MAKSTPVYRRLTGRKRSLISFSQLWLGPGHILLLRSNRFNEEYRRFALAEIQAFVITETKGRTLFQVMGLIAAMLWTAGFLAVQSVFAKSFFAVTGAVALAIAIGDIVRGPRCQCHLYTAVSRELLAPISRLSQAQRFLEQINPRIQAVQGSRPIVEAGAVENPEGPVSSPDSARGPLDAPPRMPARPFYLAEILYVLLLVNAAGVLAALRFPRTIPFEIVSAAFFGQIVFALGALVLERHREARLITDALALITIIGTAWDFISLGRIYFAWVAEVTVASQQSKPISLEFFWTPSPEQALYAAGWRVAAGLTGLAAAAFERRRSSRT